MGFSNGFGKKGNRKSDTDLLEVKEFKCPNCGEKLCKLELFIGPNFIEEGKRKYSSWWKCLCIECHKEFKVLETTYEHLDQNDPGKGTLRWK